MESIRTWQQWGANVGLRSDRFPGVDIDCADETLAGIIEDAAQSQLGPAPVRIGNPPKRLLPYRLEGEPFGKMRLYMKRDDKNYLVEILSTGQQFVVYGTHPTTLRPYSWDRDPASTPLSSITKESAAAFLASLAETVTMLGYECTRQDGNVNAARRADQSSLEAPSIADLQEAVALIPNSTALFPGWDEMIRMLHAVRAAAGADEEDGHNIFAAWAERWEGHGARHADSNDPDAVRELWRRTRGPYSVGWSWLAELARPYGFNDADFPVLETTEVQETAKAVFLSDQWLAAKVVESCASILRFVPASEQWLVWNKARWQPDAEMLAEDTVKLELRNIATKLQVQGATEKEKARNEREAREICSSGKLTSVSRLVKCDRAIAVAVESLDYDPWLLNTPGGMIDLRTAAMLPPDPDQLCTRSTSVAPDFNGARPEWDRFLEEATAGDKDLQGYLQRLGGYALTGSTREQKYAFIYGPGGNGKGLFLGVLMGILGSYHKDSPMETFVASNNDRHPTELASLAGARLVSASESEAGKRWDEAKLKRMTGGDPITARHMREDFFTYIPQFKLIFIGNHKPEIRSLDPAMMRRTHLVPFMTKPKVIDLELGSKLRAEWPAILAWLLQGCLEWQERGLEAPESVQCATEEYFSESDQVGQWIEECTEPTAADEWVPLLTLWDSWRELASRYGLYVGKIQRLSQILKSKKYPGRKHPQSRRQEFAGIKIVNRLDPVKGT